MYCKYRRREGGGADRDGNGNGETGQKQKRRTEDEDEGLPILRTAQYLVVNVITIFALRLLSSKLATWGPLETTV